MKLFLHTSLLLLVPNIFFFGLHLRGLHFLFFFVFKHILYECTYTLCMYRYIVVSVIFPQFPVWQTFENGNGFFVLLRCVHIFIHILHVKTHANEWFLNYSVFIKIISCIQCKMTSTLSDVSTAFGHWVKQEHKNIHFLTQIKCYIKISPYYLISDNI